MKSASALVFTLIVLLSGARSAELTVDQTGDDENTVGTLRNRIANANAGDTIVFDPSLSGQTIRISVANGDFLIGKELTIDGSSLANRVTLSGDANNDGSGDDRILFINGGPVTLRSLNFDLGKANDGDPGVSGSDGGAIRISATVLTIEDCSFTNNRAGDGGDGPSTAVGGRGGRGGAIANFGSGTVNLLRCTFSSNRCGEGGGASGASAGDGGDGGAILNFGTVTIEDSTFTANVAGQGGSTTASAGDGGKGGAIFNSGMITIERSTFNGNSAGNGGSGASDGRGGPGGGLHNATGTMTIRNSTIFNNSAGSNILGTANAAGGNGGGISNVTTLILENVTIIGNRAGNGTTTTGSPGNAGGLDGGTTSLTMSNTVVAGNSAGTAGPATGANPDLAANSSFTTLNGINFVGDNSGIGPTFLAGTPNGNGDFVGTGASPLDPLLGGLTDNGGSTLTMLPQTSSLLIDPPMGDATSTLATDQRGLDREVGDTVDIGAVEVQPAPAVVPVDNAALKSRLNRQIKKLRKQIKKARQSGNANRVKSLRKKFKKLRKQLRALP